jgi:hypothetical protein
MTTRTTNEEITTGVFWPPTDEVDLRRVALEMAIGIAVASGGSDHLNILRVADSFHRFMQSGEVGAA